jgi:hypothetical protein
MRIMGKAAARMLEHPNRLTTTQLNTGVRIMATQEYTKVTPEQMEVALSVIVSIADSLRSLCMDITQDGCGDNAHRSIAAEHLAAQIGWIADKCSGFDSFGPDYFLLPPIWNNATDQKCEENHSEPKHPENNLPVKFQVVK